MPAGTVEVSSGLLRRLRREAERAGSPDLMEVLVAEAVARRWFLARRLPCWRTAQSPGAKGRYGLVFPGGRRALVLPAGGATCSFDDMATAKCDYLLHVVPEGERSGSVDGYLMLRDIRKPGDLSWLPDLDSLELRPMEEFPELGTRPDHYRLSYIMGSLALLFRGELPVPAPLEGP